MNIYMLCFVQGTISGDVLIGLQVRDSEMDELNESAKKLGFDYAAVSYNDPASKLFTNI